MKFATFLKNELKKRQKVNSLYSMRAFANSLNLNSGNLSQFLSQKRKVPFELIETIGLKLGLSPEEIQNFIIAEGEKKYKFISPIDEDRYFIFSEWYISAILQFPLLKNIDRSFKSISKKLGITIKQVRLAMRLLNDQELVEFSDESSDWKLKNKKLLSIQADSFTSDAIKRNLSQQHEQSLYSLQTLNTDKRMHSGVTLAFSEADIERAKVMIKNFNREFISEMSKSSSKDKIYQLNIFLYPLTKEASTED